MNTWMQKVKSAEPTQELILSNQDPPILHWSSVPEPSDTTLSVMTSSLVSLPVEYYTSVNLVGFY